MLNPKDLVAIIVIVFVLLMVKIVVGMGSISYHYEYPLHTPYCCSSVYSSDHEGRERRMMNVRVSTSRALNLTSARRER